MSSDSDPLNLGAAGRYGVLGEIARGRMGLVCLVTDRDLGREAACKAPREYPCDPATVRRFVKEAQITAQLQHPGIPPVFEIGKLPDGRP
jgi:serine/threonine protein kinase